MSIFNALWKPKIVINCLIDTFELNKDFLVIRIHANIDGHLKNQSLLFKERESGRTLTFPLLSFRSTNSNTSFEAKIDVSDHLSKFTSGNIWDAYVLFETPETSNKYRLRSNLNENDLENKILIDNESQLLIEPYVTVKGNFSFKIKPIYGLAYIDKLDLDDDVTLTLSGYAFYPGWDDKNPGAIRKNLVLRSDDIDFELKYEAESTLRKDISTNFAFSGESYDWAGFSASIDLNKIDFGEIEDGDIDLFIELDNGTETKEVALKLSPSFNQEDLETVIERSSDLMIKRNKKTNTLSFYVPKRSLHVEVRSIYAESGKIFCDAKIYAGSETGLDVKDGVYQVQLKKRYVDSSIELPVEIVDSQFNLEIDLGRLINEGALYEGVWDLYLIINDEKIRLATRMDGIKGKQKIMVFPQQLITDHASIALVAKPYYTVFDNVSILVRNYIYPKSIQRMRVKNQRLEINGKINIMEPNEFIDEAQENGEIVVKAPYGEKYHLPVTWHLRKTNRTVVEYEFTAVCDLKKNNLMAHVNDILKNVHFDSLNCRIDFKEMSSIFSLIVNPDKVELSLEDKINNGYPVIKNVLSRAKIGFYNLLRRLLPLRSNVIVFQSFYGNSYACNPKALYEEMLKVKSRIKAVWVLKDLRKEIPGRAVLVRPRSLKYFYYMAVAKYFVNNANFPDFFKKRKGAVFLQTWHGTPLKRLGYDVDPNSVSYAENTAPELMQRVKQWDYLVVPNKYTGDILKRAYRFEKEVLEYGYPRNDVFYRPDHNEKIREIKAKLNIDPDKKVILYAPTWRDYEHQGSSKHSPFEFRFDLKKFRERFADEYVLLLRLHYFDAARCQIRGYEGFVYNVTFYDDIQELYLISDLLITDYSSVMFDYANLNRPMLFFTYDLNKYQSKVRGFYFDFVEEAPGPLVFNDHELFEALENIDSVFADYRHKYETFRNRFCNLEDGHASERTINRVFNEIR